MWRRVLLLSAVRTVAHVVAKRHYTVPFRQLKVASHLHTKLGAPIRVASPIQQTAIPLLLSEDRPDAILQAPTGSGKTLAYLLPALTSVDRKIAKPQVLIMTPTRELAVQISGVVKQFVSGGSQQYKEQPITERRLVGEADRAMTTQLKSSPPHVIVSTFACASRLVSEGHLPMDQLRFLIIDEADHIIKKHSKPFLTALLNKFVRQRQTPRDGDAQLIAQLLFVSATITDDLWKYSTRYLRSGFRCINPTSAEQVADESHASDLPSIMRRTSPLPPSLEHVALHTTGTLRSLVARAAMLRKICAAFEPKGAVLVYIRHGYEVEPIAQELKRHGFAVDCLTSETNKREKNAVYNNLTKRRNVASRIILSTEMAFRGLDLKNVSHVVLLDMPTDANTYIHCAGRVGRLGGYGLGHRNENFEEEHDISDDEHAQAVARRSLLHARGTVVTIVRHGIPPPQSIHLRDETQCGDAISIEDQSTDDTATSNSSSTDNAAISDSNSTIDDDTSSHTSEWDDSTMIKEIEESLHIPFVHVKLHHGRAVAV